MKSKPSSPRWRRKEEIPIFFVFNNYFFPCIFPLFLQAAMFQGTSCFFVVSASKRGHEWGFEKRGPPPIRRTKKSTMNREEARTSCFSFFVCSFQKGVLIVIGSSIGTFRTTDRSKSGLSWAMLQYRHEYYANPAKPSHQPQPAKLRTPCRCLWRMCLTSTKAKRRRTLPSGMIGG